MTGAGTATVVISHLVFEQERFDRICHLADGRIEEEAGRRAPASALWPALAPVTGGDASPAIIASLAGACLRSVGNRRLCGNRPRRPAVRAGEASAS